MDYRVSKPSFTCQLWMAERLRFERGLNLEKSFWGNPMTPVEEIAFAPIQSLLGSAIQSTVRKDRIEIFRVLCIKKNVSDMQNWDRSYGPHNLKVLRNHSFKLEWNRRYYCNAVLLMWPIFSSIKKVDYLLLRGLEMVDFGRFLLLISISRNCIFEPCRPF